jgi:uncharacterized protein (TIGR02596 family)
VSREQTSLQPEQARRVGAGSGHFRGSSLSPLSAFTLTELLVVITIIVIMASLMGPTLSSAVRGTALTQGADKVIGVLSLARQTAITKGQTVEVRFYAYVDPETPGDTSQYHALQAFSIDDATGRASPLIKAQTLPQTVVMTTNSFGGYPASSLLSASLVNASAPSQLSIPRVKNNYTCSSFSFLRSGTTSLLVSGNDTNVWSVTVVNAIDLLGAGASKLPANYTTVTVDPYNGSIKTFRPTL